MKDTKKCLVMFSFYDRTSIQAYLEQQAQKGWLLTKISAWGWHFKRIRPQNLHFNISYFSKASAFDPEPSEQQLSFQDFCEYTGWKLAASNAQMQIFYNEQENPTPIETDALMEIEQIHASAQKSFLPSYFLMIFIGLLQAVIFGYRFITNPISILASNASLFSGFCWFMLLLLSAVEIISYFRWHRKAQAMAQLNSSFLPTRGHTHFYLAIIILMLTAFGATLISYGGNKMTIIALDSEVIILGLTAMIVSFSELLKKWKLSAKTNRNLTILATLLISFGITGFLLIATIRLIDTLLPDKVPAQTYEYMDHTWKQYSDDIPLRIEDLTDTDYLNYSYELTAYDKSVFVEQVEARQRPRMDALAQPSLEYTVTQVKLPLLYSWCEAALLKNIAHNYGHPEPEDPDWVQIREIDATSWNADKAYQLLLAGEPEMRFLLCYDTCIVEIDFEDDWELTAEQMQIIGQKLNIN